MARGKDATAFFDVYKRMASYEAARKKRGQQVTRQWKGKERASPRASSSRLVRHAKRDEGSGGSDGIVLDLSLVGDGTWEAVYTVPVQVGSNNQSFDLQVDMGSADLWLATTSCSSSACKKAKLYDPSSSSAATQSSSNFEIQYLSGAVNGPIYWDTFTLGGYEIDNQALAAATSVTNESLNSDFSGVLGLALQADSIIAQEIPPVIDSQPDGQTVVSNLFGITPSNAIPSQFFLSLLLNRPESNRVPAVLGIGRHPSDDEFNGGMTLDPSQVTYSTPIAETNGIHWWKSELRGITVYVNGTAKEVSLGHGVSGNVFPEAVLDSGVPYIISTPAIANAVWGALGISPASDGNYYLPCTTPLNLTVTLDDRSEIPIHPLDLTAQPSGGSQCMGLFQASTTLENPEGFGDIILGVPFLRNVYTVMAYEPTSSSGTIGNRKRIESNPQLGLLNITNATLAMQEFNQVRLENEPLDGSVGATATGAAGLSTEAKVGIILGSIFALCAMLLGFRLFYTSRRNKKRQEVDSYADEHTKKEAYALAAFHLRPLRAHSFVPSEDTQATLTDPFARLDKKYDTAHSKVASLGGEDEFGVRRKSKTSGMGSDSGESDTEALPPPGGGHDGHMSWIDAFAENSPPLMGEWRPPTMHERSFSASSTASARALLNQERLPPRPIVDEFGRVPNLRPMAASGGSRRIGSAGGPEDMTLVNSRDHERKLSTSSGSSGDGDETTALTAPATSITRPPPRGALPRPSMSVTGPRPSSQVSWVMNGEDPGSHSSMYSR